MPDSRETIFRVVPRKANLLAVAAIEARIVSKVSLRGQNLALDRDIYITVIMVEISTNLHALREVLFRDFDHTASLNASRWRRMRPTVGVGKWHARMIVSVSACRSQMAVRVFADIAGSSQKRDESEGIANWATV